MQAIPGADGAGLTLLEEGRSNTIVATAPFVREIDDVQYGMGQGPCISAASEGRTVMSGSLGADSRWPRFGGRVARLGVHSVVSLPLITLDGVVGAMNVYAHAKNSFSSRAAELGNSSPLRRRSRCRTPRSSPRRSGWPHGCRQRWKPGRHRSGGRHHDEPERRDRSGGAGAAAGDEPA